MGVLLEPEKFTRTWDVIRNWVICEISKQDMESQRHIFGKSAESRKFRREQAGGKEGSENLGEWPGGSVPQFTPLTLTLLRQYASPVPQQLMQFILPFKQG